MGIRYNKQYTPKNRSVVTSGPADRQRKQALQSMGGVDAGLVEELKGQIAFLQEQLEKKPPVPEGMYTPEQVDEEILKAIKAETADLKAKNKILESKNKELVNNHKKEISSLNDIIKNKEEMIQQLRENQTGGLSEDKLTALLAEATKKIEEMAATSQGLSQADVDPNRPQMETVFVDPIEGDRKVETHLEIEDVSTDKKEQMNEKVNKLKNLMGKLPTRK